MFQQLKGNSTNKCFYAFSFLVSKHGEPQRLTFSTHNTNRHCPICFYAFVGHPLSKQLYHDITPQLFTPWPCMSQSSIAGHLNYITKVESLN